MRRWHLLVAALIVLPGLFGLTGSSWPEETRGDPLLGAVDRDTDDYLGTPRTIRTDEWAVELPMARAQQLAGPSFPMVNPNLGLGHLQRAPTATPVLDWGVAFRPLTWPLFAGTRWAHGFRWFLRDGVLLLGLLAWLGIVTARDGAPDDERRRRALVGALAAVAVMMSSEIRWWLAHTMVEMAAFAGLAVAAADRRARAAGPLRRGLWLALFAWLVTCAFFSFYPPGWAPLLWVLCAALVDLEWRRRGDVRGTVRAAWPLLVAIAGGVLLSLLYFSPYLALVADTVYPGRRIAHAGEWPWRRLLDQLWPSPNAIAPLHGEDVYLGPGPWPIENECEGAAVEATPLLLLAVLFALDGSARAALGRVLRRHPVTVLAFGVLAAWLFLPLPDAAGILTLLRWSPARRAWFAFGLSTALVTAVALAEVAADAAPRAWARLAAASAVVGTLALLPTEARLALAPDLAWRFWLPIALCAALALAGLAALRTRWGAALLAASWAGPVVLANLAVNPVVPSSALFVRGEGHRAVDAALRLEPGRLADFTGSPADVLAAYGWPVLDAVQMAPDLALFRFLTPDSPGLTEQVYNRYAHVHFIPVPWRPTVFASQDGFQMMLPPTSRRLETLGVNHLLLPWDYPPELAGPAFRVTRAGVDWLWSRREPVGPVGWSPQPWPASALDLDWRRGTPADGARVTWLGDRLVIETPPGVAGAFGVPLNLSLVDELSCADGVVRKLDAHLVVTPVGGSGARCEARFLGSVGGLRRLLGW